MFSVDGWGRECAARRAGLAGALCAAGCLLWGALGCAQPHDPLTERCLEALAYRLPGHGGVEQIERGPSSDGWTVTIRHAGASVEPRSPRRFSCEYEIGDRWKFKRIVVGEQELHENELTLVNAELFLRDLGRSPERFGDGSPGAGLSTPGSGGVSAPPPAGSGHRPSAPDA